ncbi:pentatricopeptide repeat-containing protein At1g11630, mitochondrial-like isoform X1 [Primulina huaijiensis]|uniref:pentatricopeptide repeat-containing protein At1g11630, mitochondrial-like isoform X1 n=2 Tax=Primulina huaijiensis TaxID=1492673 RepID=UPI003CC74463
MAFRRKFRSLMIQGHRQLSTSILNPDSKSSLTSKEKSRTALAFLRFEKNPERILEICREADLTPESPLDRIAYSKAISKLKESHCYDGIRSFIRESVARSESRTERCISRFIVLYGQAGLVKDAIQLFAEMPEMGIVRNVKTLNSLLFSCILAEDYGEMKRLFEEFPSKYGLVPNLDTYNTVLKGFCDSGSTNLSHRILAEMEKKGIKPNGKTFATVLTGFYTEEKFHDVGKIMELMRSYGISPGIGIYNVRIQGLCKLKRSNEAKALLDGILCRGMTPNSATFGHLIYGFCREGKLDVAKNLFKEMIDMGLKPEAECYFTLIYYLCRGLDFEVASNICEEAMGNGWVPNFTTMKSLVDGLASIGKTAEAKKIIRLVKKKFLRNADKWKEIEEGLPKLEP